MIDPKQPRQDSATTPSAPHNAPRAHAPGRAPATSRIEGNKGAVQRKQAAPSASTGGAAAPSAAAAGWGQDPLLDAALRGSSVAVQASGDMAGAASVKEAAAQGVSGAGTNLPHLQTIQQSFGSDFDVGSVRAHVGGSAAHASDAIGASAYATGNDVAFKSAPDLHTAAHEAAHIVQQQQGVQLQGGVGQAGDAYERHADAVADRVVSGQAAGDLLAAGPSGGGSQSAVQGDWLGGGVGALGGAAAGAGIGAAVGGPLGALVGGAVGAVAGGIAGHLVEEAVSGGSSSLSSATQQAVTTAISEGRKQDAVDAVVTDLAGQGQIDTSLLKGGKMTYDSSVAGEGVANPPGYDASGKALPTEVKIGDSAFTNGVMLLHTTIMHEYQHVLQFQDAASSPSAVPGQGGGSIIDQQEVEAYCWEIEHADQTGLSSDAVAMEDAWNRLHNNYWVNLSAADRTPLLAKVENCHRIAERVTGKTLVFNK